MKTLLNILWLVLSGVWMAVGYAVFGALMFVTIIGIPFGVQAFKLASYSLWPFGRTLVQSPSRVKGVSTLANVIWFLLPGWVLALGHLVTGCLLCLTVIGIPLGVASFKMAGAALVPFGKEIVKTNTRATSAKGSITVA